MTTKKAYTVGALATFLWLTFFALLLVCLSSCGTEPGIANTMPPELPINDIVIITETDPPELIVQGRRFLPVIYRVAGVCGEITPRLACSIDGTVGLMLFADRCNIYGGAPLGDYQTGLFCGNLMDREPPVNPGGPDPLPY